MDEAVLLNVEAQIRGINLTASIYHSQRGDVSLDQVLGKDAFDLDRVLEIEPKFLKHFHHHHHHDHVTSFSLSSDAPLEPERFFAWIQSVAEEFGQDMLRMKGIIAFENHDDRYVMQGIHMHLEGDYQRPWTLDEKRTSRLVFIGRGLQSDKIEQGFLNCIVERQVAAE